MERVGTLINKLQEQFTREAPAAEMAITARLLMAEIQFALQEVPATVQTFGKVSVVMPGAATADLTAPAATTPDTNAIPIPSANTPEPVIPVAGEAVVTESSVPATDPAQPETETETATETEPGTEYHTLQDWLFETPETIPTMEHQPFEMSADTNEKLAVNGVSINEQLKNDTPEVVTMLEDAPIRDLKKAISINDRYLFINTLFRGDENMFERSIRTINGFNIYPEAQYWIQRELKVKMSWMEESEVVKLFDHLVKRRFS
jgi:hypothetical protein